MSETSVKIIKNEIRCRDDTMPKTVDTRSHCKVRLRACNNLPQPPPYISVFWGCGRLLHALNLTLQWLLVSTVFGMVSSLHLISFLMIFTLVTIVLGDLCDNIGLVAVSAKWSYVTASYSHPVFSPGISLRTWVVQTF